MSAAACVLPSFPGADPPDWVRRFADEHELSPLSRREALKHL